MTVEGGAGLGDSWRATDIQDYYMPYGHGRPFERKASMELIYPDEDGENIQLEAGLRLAASDWSRGRFRLNETEKSPWTSNAAHKPSFNLFFRNEYGDEELDFPLVKNYRVRKFDQLRLRAGKNDIRNPWIKDELARRLFGDRCDRRLQDGGCRLEQPVREPCPAVRDRLQARVVRALHAKRREVDE